MTAFAQERVALDFGLRAGIPTNTLLESDSSGIAFGFMRQESFKRSSYTVGPTFAVVLYDRVLVQFDALYKPIQFLTNDTTPVAVISRSTRGGSWEFPLIFDYRFLHGTVKPYAGGGGVVGQTMSGLTETQAMFISTGRLERQSFQFGTFSNQLPAYIANAGFEFDTSHVVVRPEVRYTRWDTTNTNGVPKRRRDQVEFLIGFSVR